MVVLFPLCGAAMQTAFKISWYWRYLHLFYKHFNNSWNTFCL